MYDVHYMCLNIFGLLSCYAVVTLALDVDRSEVVEGGSLVASVVKESSGKLERPITLSLFTVEGTANGTYPHI